MEEARERGPYLHGAPTHGHHLKQGDGFRPSPFPMATARFGFVLYFGAPSLAVLGVFERAPASPLPGKTENVQPLEQFL